MTSVEIQEQIEKLEKEKEALNNDLKAALKRESKQNKDFSITLAALTKLWSLYYDDKETIESLKGLSIIDNATSLRLWLEADIEYLLIINNLTNIDEIKTVIKDVPGVNFEKCVDAAEIRADFNTALENVEKGSELSSILSWGFSDRDLIELWKLHKENKHRDKIENLLTDCNFHSEAGLLSNGKYDDFKALCS